MNGMVQSRFYRTRDRLFISHVFGEVAFAVIKNPDADIEELVEKALQYWHLVTAPIGRGRWASFRCKLRRGSQGFVIHQIWQLDLGGRPPDCAAQLIELAAIMPEIVESVGIKVYVDYRS